MFYYCITYLAIGLLFYIILLKKKADEAFDKDFQGEQRNEAKKIKPFITGIMVLMWPAAAYDYAVDGLAWIAGKYYRWMKRREINKAAKRILKNHGIEE